MRLRGRLIRDDIAVDQIQDPITALGEARIVGDDKYSASELTIESPQKCEDVVGAVGVKIASGLIRQDEGRARK